MRISLLLIVAIAFLFNGCFFNRFLQKKINKVKYPKVIIIKESKPYTLNSKQIKHKRKKTIKKKIIKSKTKNITIKKINHKKLLVKNKKNISKKILNKHKKKIKHHIIEVHKKFFEPYSIKKKEMDPELLGPQSTLNKNPLI